jgi:pantoate--beta-alanine ligase
MKVFRRIADFRAFRSAFNRQRIISDSSGLHGFVPTMGCLHEGHLELVRRAKQDCRSVTVSIFVNPSQFAAHEDLDRYPRTPDQDLQLLSKVLREEDGDAVLMPTVEELYPLSTQLSKTAPPAPTTGNGSYRLESDAGAYVTVDGLSHQLEGTIRPGHFRGVATVCIKLFNICQPVDRAYFGQKDAQQCVVIRALVRDLFVPVQIVVVPTCRELDGLAMSSRNRYLSPAERKLAPALYEGLRAASEAYDGGRGVRDRQTLLQLVRQAIQRRAGTSVEIEYISMVSQLDLREVDQVPSPTTGDYSQDGTLLSGAIRVGKTRIIDNLIL